MTIIPDWLVITTFALFGLLFGSFGNVVVWRLPRKESLSYPSSHCTICSNPIKPYDNIPVLSYLVLKGRCRHCDSPISKRYPVVEAASALLFSLAAYRYGVIEQSLPQAVFAAIFLYLLLLLSLIDIDTQRLPNSLVGVLFGFGVLGVAVSVVLTGNGPFGLHAIPLLGDIKSPIMDAIMGILFTAGPAMAIALIYQLIRHTTGFGMGDLKLLVAIGVFLGPLGGLVLPLACVLSLSMVILNHQREDFDMSWKFPFGPFIAGASVVILLYGQQMWYWYVGLLS